MKSFILVSLVCMLPESMCDTGTVPLEKDKPFKRDRMTGTVEVRGNLKNATEFDVYVYYSPLLSSSDNTSCQSDDERKKKGCLQHECPSNEPKYAIIFELDKRPEVTATCKNGTIVCIPGRLQFASADLREYTYTEAANWSQPCEQAGYHRAIKVTSSEDQWTVETDRKMVPKNNHSQVLAGRLEVGRSADGRYIMSNQFLNKIEEGNEPIKAKEHQEFYRSYAFNAFSRCVSKSEGAVVPQRHRIVGSEGCQMAVKFVGELTPYAVRGTMCELQWEELYACNNGGGLEDRKCQITVETGIDEDAMTDKASGGKTIQKDIDTRVTRIQKTTLNNDDLMKAISASASINAGIGIEGIGLQASLTASFTDTETKSKTVTDMALDEYKRAVERSTDLNADVKQNALKATTQKTTIAYTIVTPPGYFQSVMTLKMSCGRSDVYPGFIDVQSRKASSTEVQHHFAIAGSEAQQSANVTGDMDQDDDEGAELLRSATLTNETSEGLNTTTAEHNNEEAPVDASEAHEAVMEEHHVHVTDEKIVGDLSRLFKKLLYNWDGKDHSKTRKALGSVADSGPSGREPEMSPREVKGIVDPKKKSLFPDDGEPVPNDWLFPDCNTPSTTNRYLNAESDELGSIDPCDADVFH